MNSLKKFIFTILFSILKTLPPEVSSLLSLKTIKLSYDLGSNFFKPQIKLTKSMEVKTQDLIFQHHLGLSAGIDKSGKYFSSLNSLGFSFIETGTFTPLAQKGNKHPRIKRLTKDNSLINRLGINNPGISEGVLNIKKNTNNYHGILGVSIGKNWFTELEDAYKDYIFCMNKCFDCADYIAVNISSPNTKDLRMLSSIDYIEDLTILINKEKKKLEKIHNRKVPLLLKLSPDEKPENLENIISCCLSNGFSGFIISNTTYGNYLGISGGVSGELLKEKANLMLKSINEKVDQDILLIASGGISSKRDIEERLDNGAKLIQIYTSFVYKGPSIVEELLN